MKFTQLFNWLRFKLVTPFQAMRNRFFLERDSKHRRIMTNFGLTFRNSKWATYAQLNLSSKTPSPFKMSNVALQLLFVATVFILFTYLLYYFNLIQYVFGGELFWSFVELIRTSTVYGLATFFVSISALFNSTFNYILTKVFSVNVQSSSASSSQEQLLASVPSNFSHTLQLKNIKSGTASKQIEALFQDQNSVNDSLPVNALYRVSDFTQTTAPSTNQRNYQFTEKTLFKPTQLLQNKWSLFSVQSEQVKSLTDNTGLLHNLTDNTFNAINVNITSTPELQTVANLHTNYLNNIKIDRWLYRYSLLHRRSLHRAHDLTLTKRLTSLGFFSGNLTSRNLWASNFVSLTPDLQTTLTNLYKQTYGDLWSADNNGLQNPLTNVQFFESSYFWLLKRFYNLNTLDRSCVISTVNVPTNVTTHLVSNSFKTHQATDLPIRLNLTELPLFSSIYSNASGFENNSVFDGDVSYDVNCVNTSINVLSGDVVSIARSLVNDKVTPGSQLLFFNSNNYLTVTDTSLSTDFNSTNTKALTGTANILNLLEPKFNK